MTFSFALKPDDSPEPCTADAVPWHPRQLTDPHATLAEALGVLRRLVGELVQLRELAAECSALADPAPVRRRVQTRTIEIGEDAGIALELVERLARELRASGRFSVSYSTDRRER